MMSEAHDGGMDENELPTTDEVDHLFIAFDVEVVRQHHAPLHLSRHRDLVLAREVMGRLTSVVGEDAADHIDDQLEPSEWNSELGYTFGGKWSGTLTVDQWLQVARNFCLDLDDDQVLPDDAQPTLGILDAGNLIPAVSIPGTDDGWSPDVWSDGYYSPVVITSLYVAVALNTQ